MKQNKDKQIRELKIMVVVAMIGILVLGGMAYAFGQKKLEYQQELQSYQEKVPNDLQYRYNYTRCVFEDRGGNHVVCNLVMRESCLEINKIDQNCGVLSE